MAGNLGLGLALERLGDLEGSRAAYERAIAAMERQRAMLPPAARKGFLTAQAEGFPRLEAYEGRARTAADPADGFYWSENTKARVFVEALSSRLRNGAAELSGDTAEAELTGRVAGLYRQLDLAFRGGDRSAYRELEDRLEAAKREQAAFIARLRDEQPAYAAVRYPEPIRGDAVALRPGEVLIEYEVTESKTLVYVLRPGKPLEASSVAIGQKELRKQVEAFRGAFENPLDSRGRFAGKFDAEAGARLYELLVKPLLPLLAAGSKLIVVPDGVLGLLPFDALVAEPAQQPKGMRYFGDDHDIVYAQSATALTLARTLRQAPSAKRGFLVLADPVFDDSDPRLRERAPAASRGGGQRDRWLEAAARRMGLEGSSFPRLRRTGELAKAIQKEFGKETLVLVGPQASQARLSREDLSRYRHLVFATHGILDGDVPYIREPALVMSQSSRGENEEGFLTMSEVMDLTLNAEVVALTACNTGMGKEVKGEGVLGLGRAFQYAGARNVLVSQWSVAEQSTTLLAERFFKRLKEGRSPREALKAARAEVRAAGYDHPFFWAPFILMGD